MTLDPLAGAAAPLAPASAGQDAARSVSPNQLGDEFMLLLVAQLKNQNPLNPMDGTEFLSQLAQMTSVGELTKIRTLLEAMDQGLGQLATLVGASGLVPEAPPIPGLVPAPEVPHV